MERKILTILVSMLFLTLIPSAIGEIANPESDVKTTDLDVGRVFLKGFVLFPHNSDGNFTFFAIRLFYIEITPTESSCGWIILKWVTIQDFNYHGRVYEILLGLFTFLYFFGFLEEGGLEIP